MKNEQIFFSDFETVTKDTQYFKTKNDTRVLLWVIKNYHNTLTKTGTNLKTYFSCLKTILKTYKKIFIYFHNLNWDGDFILKWISKNGFKAINPFEWKNNKEENTFMFLRQSRMIYQIKVRIKNDKEKLCEVVFMCSYKLLSSSVEALGKAIGLNKHNEETQNDDFYNQEPKNNVEDYPKEYVDYAIRDVEIIRQSYINFKDNLNSIIKSKWYLKNSINLEKHFTIGSIAIQLQERYTKHFSINNPEIIEGFKIDYDTHKLASNFYFGGLTQFNPDIKNEVIECENGVAFDVNSMYPSNMLKKLPYGPLINFKDSIPTGDYLEYLELEIEYAVNREGKFLCLANWNKINEEDKTKNRYVNDLFNFKCFYLKEEFEKLKMFYHFEGVKVINRYWAKCANYLEEYVKDFYELKKKYSQLNQPANTLTYKILLNASYGKHATRTDFKELFILKNKEEYEALIGIATILNKKNYKISECSDIVKLENQIIVSGECLDIKPGYEYHNRLVAATITAYSRIVLYDAVKTLGEEYFLYCDTDSVYVSNAKNKDKLAIDKYNLGEWDIQSEYKYFITKGAKAYAYSNDKEFKNDTKARLSGVNKKWLSRNMDMYLFEENEITLINANLKLQSCPSGLILVWKDYQSKERFN